MTLRWILGTGIAALLLAGCTDTDFSPDIISRPTVGVDFDPRTVECGAVETEREICF